MMPRDCPALERRVEGVVSTNFNPNPAFRYVVWPPAPDCPGPEAPLSDYLFWLSEVERRNEFAGEGALGTLIVVPSRYGTSLHWRNLNWRDIEPLLMRELHVRYGAYRGGRMSLFRWLRLWWKFPR